jgi:Fe-S cluster assembly protein SufD
MEKLYRERFLDHISVEKETRLDLVFEKRASGSLVIEIEEGCSKLELAIDAKEYSYTKIFVQNKSNQNTEFVVHANILNDAKCQFGLLDLEKGNLVCDEKVYLKKPGATFEIYSGQLCLAQSKKITNMEIVHEAHNTYGNMHNFAVQFDDSYFEMVANGNIKDKCPESQSHQETRVLTLGSNIRNKVIPLLLIDENDVKASHALTIGQPDEETLYYLQSRGLSAQAAMGLLSIGYFMPVIDLVEEEELREKIRVDMESKVGVYGHSKTH